MTKPRYRELRPVKPSIRELEEIERRIKDAFRELVYLPLWRMLSPHEKITENAKRSPLAAALQASRVVYSDGAFSGGFSAQVSKELKSYGAVWDKKTASWRLAPSALPDDLRPVIAASAQRFQERLGRIDQRLSQVLPAEIAEKLQFRDIFDQALWQSDDDLRKTLKSITVLPELSDTTRETIAREYAENLDRYIKNFAEEEIASLREEIQHMVFRGARYETVVDAIRRSYGVSRNKARFLARQESNLLLAKFKESRYTEAGVPEYRWRCVAGSPAHPVRPAHRALDGTVQRWDRPPITTGPGEPQRRNNPGEDYNCRCMAIPLVRF